MIVIFLLQKDMGIWHHSKIGNFPSPCIFIWTGGAAANEWSPFVTTSPSFLSGAQLNQRIK